MNWKKVSLFVIIAIVIILQFIPYERPETSAENPDDLLLNNGLPDTIAGIFRAACYDCHSNETNYPWYSHVAPVSWLVTRDIRIGRENMNFSDWESLSKMDKA
ncbi:MAG: heme-binding domain-containing protein, partial [bacterium]